MWPQAFLEDPRQPSCSRAPTSWLSRRLSRTFCLCLHPSRIFAASARGLESRPSGARRKELNITSMPALVAGARRLREAQATMERLRTAGSWFPRGPQVRSTPRGAAFSIVSREASAVQFKVTA